MAETLLSGSSILMYGRVMADITLVHAQYVATESHLNHLQSQLRDDDDNDARLARIYAVSCGGGFYPLAEPTIFLVHGTGDPATGKGKNAGGGGLIPAQRGAMRPAGADDTGVAAQDYTFSEDMRVWTYDKNDISLRLDLSTGMLQDILLEAELGDDMDFPSFGGGKVGGGKVGGGKVGGGKVGGGKVGGG